MMELSVPSQGDDSIDVEQRKIMNDSQLLIYHGNFVRFS